MNLQKDLTQNSQELDVYIGKILKTWKKSAAEISPELTEIVEKFVQSSKGGKRIRGFLVKLGYRLAGGDKPKAILDPAAAYEIFHTAILAHDDVIDQSELRRGRPSLYKLLGSGHHGISQTISLSDCAFFIAVKTIANSSFASDLKVEALKYFSQTVIETGMGEILDVELPYKNSRVESDVIKIMEYKTARYTVANPLQLGALLAGADTKLLRLLGQFGFYLGVAYQIQDDILGVFGTEMEIGKSVTSDVEEGKNTLLIIEALKNVNLKQKRILHRYYGKGELSLEGLEKIREVFVATGDLAYCQRIAKEYAQIAKKMIPSLTRRAKDVKILEELVEYLLRRKA